MALQEISRRKPCLKNRIEEHIEKAILEVALEKPAYGQVRVANELAKRGLSISPAGVRCVWLRHDLQTFQRRLKALEAKAAQDSLILTEDQLRALERSREERPRGARSKPSTRAISVLRTPTMLAPSRASAGFISRPSSTPIRRWLLRSCTTGRMRLSPLRC